MVIKSIGVLSLGKVMGVVYAALGLIFGGFFTFISLIGAAFGSALSSGEEAILSLIFGVGAIFFLPVFYGVMGFVAGVITAAIYNVVAKFAGGLELQIEPSSDR